MSAHRWLMSAAVLWVVTPVAPDARAGLFRCQRPDGSVVYTDSQATCPGARPHEPQATVQSVDIAESSRRLAPAPRTFAPAAGELAEAQWRNKKQQAEQELEQLTLRASEIEPFITTCNRGGYLWMKQDNGLKKRIPCSGLREHFAELESRRTSLHEYLEHGISDECRRAGCLPGWLR
jgi:hypothetical protein